MEFAVPDALKAQLVSYDPVLKAKAKKVRATRADGTPRKEVEFPIGKVENLIPTNVVSAEDQEIAVKLINKAALAHRSHSFFKLVKTDNPEVTERKLTAILYYYESVWIALWFPAEEETDKYLYGFTYAFKNNAKAGDNAIKLGLTRKELMHIDPSFVKFGRSEFRVYTHQVTIEDITQEKCAGEHWNPMAVYRYYKKAEEIEPAIRCFKSTYIERLPRWEDSYGIYDRLVPSKNTYKALLYDQGYGSYNIKEDFYPSVDNILEIFNSNRDRAEWPGHCSPPQEITNPVVNKVFNTPFFRKWIQENCDEVIKMRNDETNNKRKTICCGFVRISRVARWIDYISYTWPEVPIDYFRTHVDQLVAVSTRYTYGRRINKLSNRYTYSLEYWLNKNMPVSSFFKLINNQYEQLQNKIKEAGSECALKGLWNDTVGRYCTGHYTELNDALNMLENVLSKQYENNQPAIDPPRRWRIAEFHDHVQAEAWKTQNENIDIPQDLFPNPVKINYNNSVWTFLQPINTHQLAIWGQAVRNCVGSAGSYAEGVKKKRHFIVLCMLDGVPRFTIQLQMRDGSMFVQQIKDVSNSRLDKELESCYATTFEMALKARAEQLGAKNTEAEEEDKQEVVTA